MTDSDAAREEFEAWWTANRAGPSRCRRDADGEYVDVYAEEAWAGFYMAWQVQREKIGLLASAHSIRPRP
jgi:hypothetical protein